MTERPDAGTGEGGKPAHCESRDFARSFDSLEAIYAFVETMLRAGGVDAAATYAIVMTIEELFTNMVKYNSGGTGPVSLQLECSTDAVTCRLVDPDSEHFDITQAPDVDIHRPVEQRRPGGLGIHLVRRMVDSISYDYTERRSTVSFVKRLAGPLRGI
jgi:anti-sigma regulatory factor (Ser/Thr protein kinase)